jgi:hypothetical protein
MSKYGQLIKEARKQENQKARKPEMQQGTPDEDVNLSIKVPKSRRQHWAAEAKRQGTTLTAAITEALSAKFGDPG